MSKPQVTITLGRSGQVDIDAFKDIFRLQRTDYFRSAGSSTNGKGDQIGQNDLRLKLLRKRTTRLVNHEVQEHTKREMHHISSSVMVPRVTEETYMPSTVPRIIRRRLNNDVLAPSIPVHSMPMSRTVTIDADKGYSGHLSGGQCLTVSSLLSSLGLGKYATNFQAEEVDMTVLKQMQDQDLKALGLPMLLGLAVCRVNPSYSKRII